MVSYDISTNHLLHTWIPHQSVTHFSYGVNAPSLTRLSSASPQPETVPHVEAELFLGQLLGYNLYYGNPGLVRIVQRALQKSPCNGASHIAFLGFFPSSDSSSFLDCSSAGVD